MDVTKIQTHLCLKILCQLNIVYTIYFWNVSYLKVMLIFSTFTYPSYFPPPPTPSLSLYMKSVTFNKYKK